ncbi:MAG: 3-hydroxyacyl-CoA dehydrogenase family protein [Candidatus Thermoplasmatota archaeon]|jgi:3-hydroxyacyl-CoA dehydrogenase|nr:3-hydroxyacyl-CoA dehydrogenase family protein [Candidatus Thermoplasmatota archaeon]
MTSSKEVRETSVIGAGVMGTGLAITMALNGIRVFLNDLTEDLLNASSKRISDLLADLEGRGTIVSASRVQDNVVVEKDLKKAVENSDMIFEAITEDPSAKRDLFEKLAENARDDSVHASNTSVIKISEIASGLKSKERIIGVHWMNPPYVAPLVEMTPSEWTGKEVVEITRNFLEKTVGKKVVLSPDIPGFIVNRFHAAVTSEAIRLIDEGVSIEDVDSVWKYHLGILYGLFGPLKNADYIGLDTTYLAGMYLTQRLGREMGYVPDWLSKKIGNNELGVKTQRGFYDYGNETPSSLYAKRVQAIREELRCRQDQK